MNMTGKDVGPDCGDHGPRIPGSPAAGAPPAAEVRRREFAIFFVLFECFVLIVTPGRQTRVLRPVGVSSRRRQARSAQAKRSSTGGCPSIEPATIVGRVGTGRSIHAAKTARAW